MSLTTLSMIKNWKNKKKKNHWLSILFLLLRIRYLNYIRVFLFQKRSRGTNISGQ